MITKKYKYYTENGDKSSCHSIIDILSATDFYHFKIMELLEQIKNTKYDMKYV